MEEGQQAITSMTEEGLATPPSQPNPLGYSDIDVHYGKILSVTFTDFDYPKLHSIDIVVVFYLLIS